MPTRLATSAVASTWATAAVLADGSQSTFYWHAFPGLPSQLSMLLFPFLLFSMPLLWLLVTCPIRINGKVPLKILYIFSWAWKSFPFDPRQLGIGKPFGIQQKMDICDWEWGVGARCCAGQKVAVHCLRGWGT